MPCEGDDGRQVRVKLGQALANAGRGAEAARQYLEAASGLDTAVALDERGQPTFTITPDVAYDHLTWDEDLERLFGQAQAVCFGTLIQRHPTARVTGFLQIARKTADAPGRLQNATPTVG